MLFSQLPKKGSTFQPQHLLEATSTKPEPEKVIENIDTAIYEIPNSTKIEIGNSPLSILWTDAGDVLKDDYVNDEVLDDKTIKQIKDEYSFDDIKDAFEDGQVALRLESFLVVKMKTLSMPVTFYHLTKTIMSSYLFFALTWDKT